MFRIGEITLESRRSLKLRTLIKFLRKWTSFYDVGNGLTIYLSGNCLVCVETHRELKVITNKKILIGGFYMLREFVKLVDEAVDDGFNRGLNLFMENLEEDLAKSEVIAEAGGVDVLFAAILENDGYEVELRDEDLENLDESKIDAMLEHFKKEGIS